jgi:hypothetical protein
VSTALRIGSSCTVSVFPLGTEQNPHGRGHAVRVDVNGSKVGYLPSEEAGRYRPNLDELWRRQGALGTCPGFIMGGGDRHYGMWLRLGPPDRLVFDLDPGDGVAWRDVVAAARDVRDKLAASGLESWVRMTGGKGLHVMVPIARGPDWDEAKEFCEVFAKALAEHAPDRYVATATKAKRRGRIFIDWLRNARGATSVCSWSLRARPGAPVAMPLRWEELGRAKPYDLRKALRRAAALDDDPWARMRECVQRLP